MKRIRFIVAEKSYLIRKGIVSIINRIEKASVVSELDQLNMINSEILKYNPDFIVINASLLEKSDRFINTDLKFDLAGKGIAILTGDQKQQEKPYIFKEAIHIDDEKDVIFSRIENLVRDSAGREGKILQNELTEREKLILKWVAMGLTNKEIADKLFISAHTVITHRKNITAKLGIKTISGLTVYAILNNIISLNEVE